MDAEFNTDAMEDSISFFPDDLDPFSADNDDNRELFFYFESSVQLFYSRPEARGGALSPELAVDHTNCSNSIFALITNSDVA